MSHCAVHDCQKLWASRRYLKSYFKFPKDFKICEQWVQRCKRKDLEKILVEHGSDALSKDYVMCSDHFSVTCFRNPNVPSQGLKKGSIPSLNLNLDASHLHSQEEDGDIEPWNLCCVKVEQDDEGPEEAEPWGCKQTGEVQPKTSQENEKQTKEKVDIETVGQIIIRNEKQKKEKEDSETSEEIITRNEKEVESRADPEETAGPETSEQIFLRECKQECKEESEEEALEETLGVYPHSRDQTTASPPGDSRCEPIVAVKCEIKEECEDDVDPVSVEVGVDVDSMYFCKEESFTCQICEMEFKSETGLKAHELGHAVKESYSCPRCGKSFAKKCAYKSHVRNFACQSTRNLNKRTQYPCKYCNTVWKSSSNLRAHLLEHPNVMPYGCFECKKVFSKKSYFEKHKRDRHPNTDYNKLNNRDTFSCEVCKRRFISQEYLDNHSQFFTRTDVWACGLCHVTFKCEEDIKVHNQVHEVKSSYTCKVCGKAFGQKCNFKAHVRIHTGERPYLCYICNKGFVQQGSLTSHMLHHSGERPYECDACKKSFAKKSYLKEHTRIHTGDRPFLCPVCQKPFISNSQLQSHVRDHSGEKPFECNICSKRFLRKFSLESHLNQHAGKRPYKCDLCVKAFLNRRGLRKHRRRHDKSDS